MKKYSFIIWIIIFVLLLGGGYYFIQRYGSPETPAPVSENTAPEVETPSDTEIPDAETPVEAETPAVDDAVSKLRVKTPFAPEFTLKNENDEDVSLADYKGRKVIVNFWASWCPPCVYEMPEFQTLHDELDPEKTVLLAINLTDGQRETRALADEFLKENNLDLNVLYDTKGDAFYGFNISSIPQTFVIDDDGLVQYAIMGMTDKATLDAILERME
ncbi:redoxin domain-containing protein [Proteiniclasticum sp.]|uniref:redoxin domain-containing protein n=1 Tax=Proteiniclasticum sp. TaxID=2053595 RepID=UPI00289CBA5F|nr:redoxin domain-containing protein [Proteiniclasticum sp.]